LKVKVARRSALVQIAPSSQLMTAHAGLVLVRELAERLGLPNLLDAITVKKRRRGYSPGEQVLALCETLIAGGECLDDAALLRSDAAQQQLRGHAVPDPTTLGRFLARFTLGHVHQLNRALDQLFAHVHPLLEREQVTLDLDSTLVEHHGPAGSRQGTRGTYAGKVAWHPLVCFIAETGEWLHAKLRNGHAAPSTGARRFLGECLRRLPARTRRFLRADEGFYGQGFLAELEANAIVYTVGAPLIASVRQRIGEIPEADWQPSSYRSGSQVASFTWKPKTWERERRFVARRDPVERGEQLTLEGSEWHYWAFVTNDGVRSADELESWHRDKANVENRIKEAKLALGLDNLPCRGFHANWAYLLCTLLAYDLLCWLKLLALPAGEHASYAKRLRFRFISVAATVGCSGRRLVLRLSAGYALLTDFVRALERIRGLARAPA
jgi:Transposase DDE domain group 1